MTFRDMLHRSRYFITISTIILVVIVSRYLFFSSCDGIVEYNANRDRKAIIKLFKDNWYWLIPEGSDFSEEYFLDHKSPSGETSQWGIETIMVYCIKNKPIGFVSYYPESFYKGRLHFIVIDKDYRGKGYSEKLMEYALKDMQKKHIKIVVLVTRTDNKPAQKLYNKLGFKEFWHDQNYVRFEKEI